MVSQKWALFMDNLSVHRSRVVAQDLARRDVTPIFNVVYSPEYNPIEMSFALVKNRLRSLKTNAIINHSNRKTLDLIKTGFGSVDLKTTKNHINHCERLIQERGK